MRHHRSIFRLRGFLMFLAILMAFTWSLKTTQASEPKNIARKPNIVLIYIDDMGWRDLQCYGSRIYESPNIDRFARGGMTFTNAYAPAALCSPSRAGILTGVNPACLRVTNIIQASAPVRRKLITPRSLDHLPLETTTLAEALHPLGYLSASIGKWHLGGEHPWIGGGQTLGGGPLKHGFDVNIAGSESGQPPDYYAPYQRLYPSGRKYYLPNLSKGKPGEYLTDRLTDEAIHFVEQNKDRPFFLYLPYFSVHTSMGNRLQAASKIIKKYKNKIAANPDDPQKNAIYAAMVQMMDQNVGRFLDRLHGLGLDDQTVVIFMSDNGGYGEMTSNLPLRGSKSRPYEGGIRVPLIIRWPGVTEAASVCDQPVTGTDLYPTILEAVGQPNIPATLEGKSLKPLLAGQKTWKPRAFFWHFPHYNPMPYSVVRQGDYKLIEFLEDGHQELYNLSEDLGETQDLAKQEPAKVRQLAKLLNQWRKKVNAQMPQRNPDMALGNH